ncbi:hypothetical protein N8I84_32860 [Streptomyces cynarae]|uniref:Sigma-70 family RNA polymerase sigma factor n=1 Tax=Streptomyces cynarae TaxID=2981134 RepID=A0ABY6E8D5_9ACTN|nr:hypothetical protein [Streptomyces cynarae]UXY22960.1 hypothetical protein N8I84_32860 [Streptomyces cynarae]
MPARLVCDEPDRAAWPVDLIRTHLAHPSTRPELREQTWREVIRRARSLGDPWGVVAVAMSVPVLRRMLARLARPAHLERAEVEQEALAGVAAALCTVDVDGARPDRELFRAADRAVHRLVYAARQHCLRETELAVEHPRDLGTMLLEEVGEPVDEFTVLAQALQAGVVTADEARLIARTRLYGEQMKALAVERGVSWRQLYRHRSAAERHLKAYVRHRIQER